MLVLWMLILGMSKWSVCVQIPCDVLISVKIPQASQLTTKSSGKQAALAAAADSQVFDVTPTHCTIQPGSHAFTTVTFSPVALQVHLVFLMFLFCSTAGFVCMVC